MKPIELTMEAFGTFADKCTISFEKLSKNSVFLIAGETGSGKTTIFDAICFALYGTASGDNRNNTSYFRSQYVRGNFHTCVTLIFECGNKIYKITRNPSYIYTKTNKKNETTSHKKNADADLYEIKNGEEILICSGVKSVNEKTEEITGIKNDQFRRIIMIAQGEFQKFLFADTKEKGAILQNLFGTEPYAMLKEKLAERKSEIVQKTDYQKLQIITELNKIMPLDENQKTYYMNSISDEDNLLFTLTRQRLPQILDILTNSRKTAQNSISELTSKKNSIISETEKLRAKIEKGKIHNDRIMKYNLKNNELQKIKHNLNTASENYNKIHQNAEKIESLERQKNLVIDKMEKYEIFEVLKNDVLSLERQRNSCLEIYSKSKNNIEILKSQINTLNEYLSETKNPEIEKEKIENLIISVQNEIKNLKETLSRIYNYKNALMQFRKIQQDYDTALEIYSMDKKKFDFIEENFYMSSAGNLALTLQENCPCPVCGSLIHPSPAVKTDNSVSEYEYNKAKKDIERKRETIYNLKNEVDKSRSIADERKIDDNENTISENISVLSDKLDMLNKEKMNNSKEIRLYNENQRKLKDFQEQLEKITESITIYQENLKNIENKLSAKKAEMETIRKDMSFPDIQSVKEYIKNIETQVYNYNKSLADAEKLLLKLQTDEKSVSDSIAELYAEINNIPEYDINGQTQKYKQLNSDTVQITDKISELKNYCSQCDSVVLNVNKISDEFFENQRKKEIYNELYKKITGDFKGAEKISLESFVQAYYLNNILSNANMKLNVLSNGRYSLIRCEEEASRNYKAGLNIEVYDSYTDARRSVKMLSGGEIFLASLSLALGLSDTIQHRSGGIKIDAMFIDEGFGSLDSGILENVIKILEQLSDNNRMIGIISHVSELSERFDSKLIVKKGEHGSRIIINNA